MLRRLPVAINKLSRALHRSIVSNKRPQTWNTPLTSARLIFTPIYKDYGSQAKPDAKQDIFPNPEGSVKNIDEFNAQAKEGKATLKDAHLYLKSSRETIERLPKPEQRQAASSIGASHILLWLFAMET